jgi:hypothetical protein
MPQLLGQKPLTKGYRDITMQWLAENKPEVAAMLQS